MNGFMTPGPFKSTLYLGMVVNVSLTGSHTNASYPTKVVYINQTSTIVHLLGTTNLGNANFTTARAYRWTATLTLGNRNRSYTINNCMNPTSTQIMTYCSGYQTGFTYWCNDYHGSNGWFVHSNGSVYDYDGTTTAYGVLPYIIVNL